MINLILIKLLILLPKSFVKVFANRYVAGETHEEALHIVKKINRKGFSVTLDILGEHTADKSMASNITSEYLELYDKINNQNLKCNISVKPSHIGLDISEEEFLNNIDKISKKADSLNNFLRIDMEDSRATDITINTYKKLRSKTDKVGTVFQAYLFRTFEDIKKIKDLGLNIRLCKGIYKEDSKISLQNRKQINKNYLKILKYSFENDIYVGIATHDSDLISKVYNLINDMNIKNDRFEFQTLYGVPMSYWLNEHLRHNYKVRIYVPFGPEWYDYSIRRLQENPNIAGYVLKNIFKK